MSNLIEEAIREHWGERCPDFDPGCLGCLAWKAVDELASLRSDNERLRAALLAFADHFGPLEGNPFLHEGALRCFALARAALEEGRT